MIDQEFLVWLEEHHSRRANPGLESVLEQAGGAENCAIVVVDLIQGFCRQGPLASEAVGGLVKPIVAFLKRAREGGVTRFFFPCDAHQVESPEFGAFPPHCIEGSQESELVEEVKNLDFFSLCERIDKRSVSSLVGTDLSKRLMEQNVNTIVCAGDCTDLCLYHLAVGLRFYANQEGLDWQVIVPQDLVATYDLPVSVAKTIGTLPHPAGLMNALFLYHLELNGVRVVGTL